MADILLIEDDPHQRALAAAVLGAAGHSVREAANGGEGLQQARATLPDLVVCDVVMPGTNGYQVVAAMRSDPALCVVPVILLTSLAERAQVRAGMTAGADDYLPKPFQPHELIEAVAALLRHRQAQGEAVAERLAAALERQKELLGARYEAQMLQEVQARWRSTVDAGGELSLDEAVLLAADLFDVVERDQDTGPARTQLLRQVHQAASDSLYLFGAAQVLQHGRELLAVFRPDVHGQPSVPHALRGATALHAAVARVVGGTVSAADAPLLSAGIALGPLTLVHLQDPLHGDGGVTVVPGPTVDEAAALRRVARDAGWAVAASGAVAALVPGAMATTGRQAPTAAAGVQAVEMLRAAA